MSSEAQDWCSSDETANTQLPRNTSMLRDKPEAPSHSPR